MRPLEDTGLDHRLQNVLERVLATAIDRSESAAVERLRALNDRLQDRRFHVAVLGEFKRGKSTLVNALLGSDVLPTGVLPLTSVITAIAWGADHGATITFEDGRTIRVGVHELGGFVTEAGNPTNEKRVRRADVEFPSRLLEEGVILLDTPGVGSVHVHNTQSTEGLLSDVDAAILVLSADPPISAAERAFLGRIRAHAHKVFFVVNKLDLLHEADQAAVMEFTRGIVAGAVGQEVDLFGVSAIRALDGDDEGFASFVDAFSAFLVREKGSLMLASIAGKLRDVVTRLRAGVAVELDALRLSREEIARRRTRVADVRASVERAKQDLRSLVKAEVRRVVATVDEELSTWRANESAELMRRAERALLEEESDPTELDGLIKGELRLDIDRERPNIESRVLQPLTRSIDRFVAQAESEADRAVAACSQILALDLPPAPALDGSIMQSRFTYSLFEPPATLEGLLPGLPSVLPRRVAGRIALARVREKIPASWTSTPGGSDTTSCSGSPPRSRSSHERSIDTSP
jgi:GTP-binding protein EngB required for normal cell division